jgi:DNA polymerase elongation subunit (family B)
LKARYEKAIRDGEWPIERLAKTERLQDSPATYEAKRSKGKTPRNAAYELALKSGRPYRAGDQLSYYVTGSKKSVSVHDNCKLVSEWDAARRDENMVYYLAKLDELYDKFADDKRQGELEL